MGRQANEKWAKRAARYRGLGMRNRHAAAAEYAAKFAGRRPLKWRRACATS